MGKKNGKYFSFEEWWKMLALVYPKNQVTRDLALMAWKGCKRHSIYGNKREMTAWDKDVRKEYRVRAVGEDNEGNDILVEYDDEANYFGVYEVKEDGFYFWVASFDQRADAEMFALEKEKEEIK